MCGDRVIKEGGRFCGMAVIINPEGEDCGAFTYVEDRAKVARELVDYVSGFADGFRMWDWFGGGDCVVKKGAAFASRVVAW